MNNVITSDQARQITRGRTPLVPVEYEAAVTALTACLTLDEAKYWDNKADALAAWAKIYHDGGTLRKAKALKLYAFRRMGQLAAELRPIRSLGGMVGFLPGPASLLREKGLSKSQSEAARTLARVSKENFEQALENPKSPYTVARELGMSDPLWREFSSYAIHLRSFCRSHTPASFAPTALSCGPARLVHARELVVELIEWLDDLERRLPKGER